METVRLRIVFEDRHLLNRTQKSEGLKRSWLLLKPELETISDLSSHLSHSFNLHHACPNGLRISMDGFVLPSFESTRVFKDKDIIRVKRKEGAATETIEIGDEANSLEDSEVVERPHKSNGVKLLALEEFEKETGGYQSEPEEIEYDSPENTSHQATPSSGNTTSKKRKLSENTDHSKRKKIKSTCSENSLKVPVQDVENYVELNGECGHQKGVLSKKSLRKDKSSKSSVKLKKASKTKVCNESEVDVELVPTKERCDNLQENGEKAIEDVVLEGAKKGPSRSARRKKAKRKWLKEIHDNQKKELIQNISDKVVCNKSQADQESEEKGATEAEIVPVVVRPGHIRFEPLDTDQVIQQSHVTMENFQWNGVTKRKGQKWGMEKGSVSWSNDHKDFRESSIKTEDLLWNGSTSKRNRQKWVVENTSTYKTVGDEDSREKSIEKHNAQEREPVHNPVVFEKLNPLPSLPKEGDVVAYRVVELSSIFSPELSSFRVGKVSWFDPASNVVMLVPVPGYPIICDEKGDEDETALESDTSLYFEDGSLEIDFKSLVDVRIFNHGHSNPEPLPNGDPTNVPVSIKVPTSNKEATSSVKSNGKNDGAHVRTTENGGLVDAWEEISQVLNEKKTQLEKEREECWSRKDGSGKSQWSSRSLRSNGLGATMALLRANGL